jgi:serine/threonine-protein phosphatase PGAM5
LALRVFWAAQYPRSESVKDLPWSKYPWGMRLARRALAPAAAVATAATSFAFGQREALCDSASELHAARQQIALLQQQLAHSRSGKRFVEWDDNWDGKAKKGPLAALKSLQKGPTRHILFIRHGQYTMAKEDEGRKLTDLGRAQARLTAEHLATLAYQRPMQIEKIYSSNLCRARETAEIIANQFPNVQFEQDALLAEGVPCASSPGLGLDVDEGDLDRLETAFHKYMHRLHLDKKGGANGTGDVYEIIVCHGNVIRYFCCRLMQLPPEAWSRFEINNCGVTHITIKPTGTVTMLSLGDTTPIPDELVTFN